MLSILLAIGRWAVAEQHASDPQLRVRAPDDVPFAVQGGGVADTAQHHHTREARYERLDGVTVRHIVRT